MLTALRATCPVHRSCHQQALSTNNTARQSIRSVPAKAVSQAHAPVPNAKQQKNDTATVPVPATVNWHLTPHCNYSCRFCFATFEEIDHTQALKDMSPQLKVLDELASLGFSRVTFVGGEPLLHPNTDRLIHETKARGMDTCLVTNGSLLTVARLRALAPSLDILAFSVDASSDALNALLGRGLRHEITQVLGADSQSPSAVPNAHISRVLRSASLAHELGITLKVNTVVTSVTLSDAEPMSHLIRTLNPTRWKLFQVLPVEGQNTGSVEPLLINTHEFDRYVSTARACLHDTHVSVVPEDNDDMKGSYAMMDALGRFFTNNTSSQDSFGTGCGAYIYGPSVLEVGGASAWHHVASHFRSDVFEARGGVWDYGQGEDRLHRERERAKRAAEIAVAGVGVVGGGNVEATRAS